MKKFKHILQLFFLVVLINGCITIEENYSFNKDGSGTMEYIIDMSELESIMKEFGNDDKSIQQKQSSSIDSISKVLEKMENIKNVKKYGTDWVHKLSFDFVNADALNNALNVLSDDGNGPQWSKNGKKWTRTQHSVENIGGNDDEKGIGKEMLEQMLYKITVSSKKKITKFNGHEDADTNIEKKMVTLNSDFDQLIENPDILSFSITIK